MGFRAVLAKPFAAYIHRQTNDWSARPDFHQNAILKQLIGKAKNTVYGKDHDFVSNKAYEDFVKRVPIGDYESLKPYIQKNLEGHPDILWSGKPIYFAKTSGTTSGIKYIPVTRDSIPNHINGARNALLSYIHE